MASNNNEFPLLDHVSSTTRWLNVRRQIMAVNDDLEAKRNEVQSRETEFSHLQQEIDKKHDQLQKDYKDVDNIIQQTFKRRTRAERIIRTIHDDISHISQDIAQLNQLLSQLSKEKADLEVQTEKQAPFIDYLNSVVAVAPEYNSVEAIRRRFITLSDAHSTLIERASKCDQETEEVQAKLNSISEEHDAALLQQTNHINKLQNLREHFEARAETIQNNIDSGRDKLLTFKTRRAEVEAAVLALELRVHHALQGKLEGGATRLEKFDSLQKLDSLSRVLCDASSIIKRATTG
ncbi:hypothetical protein P9112_011253 [Eukaryota sp. TZLM1-RC]